MSASVLWYAGRAGGVLAYVLLSASVVLGLGLAGRTRTRWPRFAVEDVHRFLALLTGVFLALHVGALALDSFVPLGLRGIVVPFGSPYRPLAVGLGVVGAELLVAIAVTNALRTRLPYRLWRRAHYATLAVWLAASAHGILSGTDRRDPWLLALYVAATAAVIAAGTARLLPKARWPELAAVVPVTAAVVAALAAIPEAAPPARAATAAPRLAPSSFTAPISAQVEQGGGSGFRQLVSVVGSAGKGELRVDLLVEGDRLERSALQLRFPGGELCSGDVSEVGNDGLHGSCTLPDGAARNVRATWSISRDGSVSGRLAATA